VSKDYLKSLDPKLAPYPFDKVDEWKRLTSFITDKTLETVLGKDGQGDARCDALMASLADESEGNSTQASEKKQFWGKPRPAEEVVDADMQDVSKKEGKRDRLLRFPVFNLKRSWRPGATGEQLSRDSRDKSWVSTLAKATVGSADPYILQLLSHVVATDLDGGMSSLIHQV
jgi:A1 cistron-splicing factor AAR2